MKHSPKYVKQSPKSWKTLQTWSFCVENKNEYYWKEQELGENLIGRDPNTGALKYGPGSVLSGKNVISGFGTNDYETALMDYITKMTANKRISEAGKAAKLAAAQAELKKKIWIIMCFLP